VPLAQESQHKAFQPEDFETGNLIAPLVWSLSYQNEHKSKKKGESPFLKLDSPVLLFRNIHSSEEYFIHLDAVENSRMNTSLVTQVLNFYTPPIFALPEGVYELKGLMGFLNIDGKNSVKKIFPFLNPFEKSLYSSSVLIHIKKNKTAILPRMIAKTEIKKVGISFKHDFFINVIDHSYISFKFIEMFIKNHTKKDINFDDIILANPNISSLLIDFQDIKNISNSGALGLGFTLDVPCNENSFMVFSLENLETQKTYSSIVDFKEIEQDNCSINKIITRQFPIYPGKWSFKYSKIGKFYDYKAKIKESDFNEDIHNFLESYFLLNDFLPSKTDNLKITEEIELNLNEKPFNAVLHKQDNLKDTILYMGGLHITHDKDNPLKFINVYFKNNYLIENLKENFKKKFFYNAYNLEPLIKDKINGNLLINYKFEAPKNLSLSKTQEREFKNHISSSVGKCILLEEKRNPLYSFEGTILIKYRFVSSSWQFIMEDKKISEKFDDSKFIDCFKQSLDLFHFSQEMEFVFNAIVTFSQI
ncbi:MAG: hypothetical protein K2X39_02250, partial [Silvanigrellaceae bacterium]|nr:hypothetical protein [Silvanigrellaceae bacterium]